MEGLVTRIICKGYNEATIKFRTTEKREMNLSSTPHLTKPIHWRHPQKLGREARVKLPLIAPNSAAILHATLGRCDVTLP